MKEYYANEPLIEKFRRAIQQDSRDGITTSKDAEMIADDFCGDFYSLSKTDGQGPAFERLAREYDLGNAVKELRDEDDSALYAALFKCGREVCAESGIELPDENLDEAESAWPESKEGDFFDIEEIMRCRYGDEPPESDLLEALAVVVSERQCSSRTFALEKGPVSFDLVTGFGTEYRSLRYVVEGLDQIVRPVGKGLAALEDLPYLYTVKVYVWDFDESDTVPSRTFIMEFSSADKSGALGRVKLEGVSED